MSQRVPNLRLTQKRERLGRYPYRVVLYCFATDTFHIVYVQAYPTKFYAILYSHYPQAGYYLVSNRHATHQELARHTCEIITRRKIRQQKGIPTYVTTTNESARLSVCHTRATVTACP